MSPLPCCVATRSQGAAKRHPSLKGLSHMAAQVSPILSPYDRVGLSAFPVGMSSPLPPPHHHHHTASFRVAVSSSGSGCLFPGQGPHAPSPHWPHTGPQACQRASSLCRSQHAEYLMSDERFHLLTQAKWQNNAGRDMAPSLSGSLARPWLAIAALSVPYLRQPPMGTDCPSAWRESSWPEIHTSLHSIV